MFSQITASEPRKIVLELTLSMKLEEWLELQQDIKRNSHPARFLDEQIDDMVSKAQAHFYPEYSTSGPVK